jgi:uncharacterized membrane protein
MNKYVREIAVMGAIAALYVALCYAFAFMSYGPVQFRIAEILLVLVFYNKKYCIPVIIGTFIANQLMYGLVDMIVGTFATVLVCLIIMLFKNKIIIAPAAALINGLIIGSMLYFIFEEPYSIGFIMANVAIGEFAVVLLGVLAFSALEKTNPKVINIIKDIGSAKNMSQKV